jgi:thiol:disulfide interchange protein DsbG
MSILNRIVNQHAARRAAFVIGVALAPCSAVLAAQAYPKILNQAVNAGVKVVRSFPAVSGLTGWVLSQGGHYSVVYTTADKKTLLAGSLIGENGENLSAKLEEQFVPKPDFTTLFQRLEKASYVTEGTAHAPKGVVYVFVDPNCPFCHFTWQALQPYEAAGLQVRWIPVATLGPTSLPKAVEVLAAADKTAAFKSMEANHGKPWSPSAQSAEASHPTQVAALRQNGELMDAFGISGTPGVIWRDKQGKVQVKAGMPRLSELPAITGLPEQKIDDPSLSKFR